MTEYRDAYPCAVDGWCRTPDGAYARLEELGRAFQYRIVTEPKGGVAATPLPDLDQPREELDWRSIPPRNPEQLSFM